MKRQMKNIGMTLLIGATMMTMVGCGNNKTEEEVAIENSIRRDEVKTIVTEAVETLGEATDFSEPYIGYYKDDMNERDYINMMIEETKIVVEEKVKAQDVKEEEINIEALELMIESEIKADLGNLPQEQNQEAYVYEEIIEGTELNTTPDHDMDGREINEDLNGYIFNNFPGYKGGDIIIEGDKACKNVLDTNGQVIAKIEMDYLTTGIIRVCE